MRSIHHATTARRLWRRAVRAALAALAPSNSRSTPNGAVASLGGNASLAAFAKFPRSCAALDEPFHSRVNVTLRYGEHLNEPLRIRVNVIPAVSNTLMSRFTVV